MRRILIDTLKIFLITLIAGLLLGAVFVITKEPIKRAQEATRQAAFRSVFEDGKNFETVEVDEKIAADILAQGGFANETIDEVVKAVDESGKHIGYVVTVTTSAGYGGNITLSVGIRLDGTVNGYSILSMSETAGLGAKAKEEKFSSQFINKIVDKFVVTKTGASADNEVDAITSATITSKAVTNAVNACIYYMQEELTDEGGNTNE